MHSFLQQGQCKFNRKTVGGTQIGVIHIPKGNEVELQSAVATAGPIAVAFDGSSNAFRVRQYSYCSHEGIPELISCSFMRKEFLMSLTAPLQTQHMQL